MTTASAASATRPGRVSPWLTAWAVALAATLVLYLLQDLVPWVAKYPKAWIVPLKGWISDFMKWLINDLDFGLFTFKELTRSVAWLLTWPLVAAQGLLAEGLTFSSDPEAPVLVPRISWIALIAVMAGMGYVVRDWKLAVLIALCFIYLAVFGQWDSAMVTLSSIAIAVPIGIGLGLWLGILGFRRPHFEQVITPILDLMQTVPVFAYLVPVLFLFGFGPVAAMIATVIYATPPMVRVTMLALRQVPTEVVEFGRMAGCTRRQLLWKVQIPSARPGLMVGVNQVIMLSLNMVIIASMIGAGGLGFDVLTSLKRLNFGQGMEAGLAITLLAIALDRLSQAFAVRPPPVHAEKPKGFIRRNPYLVAALGLIGGGWLVGAAVDAVQTYPEAVVVTTGKAANELMKWVNVNFFDMIEAVKAWLLINVMVPFKRFLLALPWLAVIGMVALAGWQLRGWRLALPTALLALFIAVTGQWEKAMISVYLCGISTLIACSIGIPVGIWAARNDRVHKVVQPVIDTLQTLPAFVYLIPSVMLLRVGDTAAMLAIVAYAIVPSIRYTDHGIRQVPPHLVEAARAMGCTRRQTLMRVQLPLALPEIMLGINQTIMMALAMLVITALVGTRDLGQEVYIALTKADTGRGIVAGVSVAFIAMIADRLIGAWSHRKKQELGLA